MVSQMRLPAAIVSLSLPLLIGCGFSTHTPIASSSGHVSGKVFGGQNPISGSTVTVWQVGSTGYGSLDAVALATTTSASDGTFDIPPGTYICPTDNTQVYITAAGGTATPGYSNSAIMLATGLGNCSSAQSQIVEINELTTVVTAYALESFYTYSIGGSTNTFGSPAEDMSALALSNAHTIPTLINLPDGTVNPDTATLKIEAAKIYSLANALAACVNSTSASTACTDLFNDATDPGSGAVPTDTLQAVAVINFYPYQNVAAIYNLGVPQAPFVGLGSPPNDWTIGVSYTTNTMGLGIAGTATSATGSTIDIDTSGRVWVPSNLPGAAGAGYFDPATNTFSGPFVATGVTLTQPQYVAIDESGFVWLTDALSNNIEVIDSSGAMAPVGGPITAAKTLGPISIDPSGNAFLSYTDSSGVGHLGEITPSSNPANSFTSVGTFTEPPTGLAYVAGGAIPYGYASSSGSSTACLGEALANEGSVPYTQVPLTSTANATAPYASNNCRSGGAVVAVAADDTLSSASSDNVICSSVVGCFASTISGFFSLPEGLVTDGGGDEWNANAGNASVATFYQGIVDGEDVYVAPSNAVPYLHGSGNGNTMTVPYGVAIDGSGNLWASNASCVTTTATQCTPTSFVLSELIGVGLPTITPLSNQAGGTLAGSEPGAVPVSEGKGQPMLKFRRMSTRKRAASSEAGFVFLSGESNGRSLLNAAPAPSSVKLP